MSYIVQQSVQINKPIIGISINYRMAAFGFINSAEIAATGNQNLGLRDQRTALRWVGALFSPSSAESYAELRWRSKNTSPPSAALRPKSPSGANPPVHTLSATT